MPENTIQSTLHSLKMGEYAPGRLLVRAHSKLWYCAFALDTHSTKTHGYTHTSVVRTVNTLHSDHIQPNRGNLIGLRGYCKRCVRVRARARVCVCVEAGDPVGADTHHPHNQTGTRPGLVGEWRRRGGGGYPQLCETHRMYLVEC
jgi:hypothetical protein